MKILRSFVFAWQGLKYCLLTQTNFRIHLLLIVVTLFMAVYFKISSIEWLIVLLCIGSVIILEMLNTAIEKMCDLVQKDFHPQIKIIKDIGAGAVLVSAVMSFCVGLIIFLPKIIHFFLTV